MARFRFLIMEDEKYLRCIYVIGTFMFIGVLALRLLIR
jgi:hypothetical protein